MRLYKRVFETNWAQKAVSFLAASYLRFVRATGSWEVRNWENIQRLLDADQPVILCFWHSRLIANAFGWKSDKALHMLSTPHRDGKLAAMTYNRLGVKTVWGSTRKGGSGAVRGLLKVLKGGGVIAITPDGPRGPRQRMNKSAIDIARMAGATLVPITNTMTRAKMLNTWDQMLVPLPFAKGLFVVGEPLAVPKRADDAVYEEIRIEMERRLNAIMTEADRETGIDTPEPAVVKTEGAQT